jgi:phage tail-like protein
MSAGAGADASNTLTQVSKFGIDITGDGKTKDSAWWGISGGDNVLEVISYTTGEDPDEKKRPGQGYYTDIVLKGPMTKDRKDMMLWINETTQGQRKRKTCSLQFLNDKDEPLMSFTLSETIPVGYQPPGVNASNYEMLEEVVTLHVYKIAQA